MRQSSKWTCSLLISALLSTNIMASSRENFVYQHITEYSKTKLEAQDQVYLTQLQNLKSSATKLNVPDSAQMANALDKIISDDQYAIDNCSHKQINFLSLQVTDAINMIRSVNYSAIATLDNLRKMHKLAKMAATAKYSPSQIQDLDIEFQGLLSRLTEVQTVNFMNGKKVVSHGDIHILFGEGTDPATTLAYPVNAFDTTSLDINTLAVNSVEKARQALVKIDKAILTVLVVIAQTNDDVMNDATTVLLITPQILNQYYKLFSLAIDAATKASSGYYTSYQLYLIDLYFNQIKMSMNKIQIYVSLTGPKQMGAGKIHIRIGNNPSDEATLTIQLPVTDEKKLGLENLHLISSREANETLTTLFSDLYNFVYGSLKGLSER